MYRAGWAVLLALAFGGCDDGQVIILDPAPPDVIINQDCPCVEGSGSHDVYITEEVYVTETVYITEEDTTPDVVQEFYGDAADLPVLLWSGIGEPMPKKVTDLTPATALADDDLFLIEQSGTSKSIAGEVFLLPMNYIAGLNTSNAAEADHDILIQPGIARSDDDTASLRLPAELEKEIDSAWAVGDNDGGMDTGAVAADTMYALWLIKRPDTGVVDALFSLSFTAPTMPADYTKKRLIAAVKTQVAGANIVAYLQRADHFAYLSDAVGDEIIDVDDSSLADGVYETGALSVPPHCLANVQVYLANPTATAADMFVGIKTVGVSSGAFGAVPSFAGFSADAGSDALAVYGAGTVLTNENKQIEYAANTGGGTPTLKIATVGFNMLTRRDP